MKTMQEQATRVKVEQVACAAGEPIQVLRFTGDITSASQAAVLGTYQGLKAGTKRDSAGFLEGGVSELEWDRADHPDDDRGEQRGADDPDVRADAALSEGVHDGGDYAVYKPTSG